jgi:hypothetical protein
VNTRPRHRINKVLARELAERYGVNVHTITSRMRAGVTGTQLYEPAKPKKSPTGRGYKPSLRHPWRPSLDYTSAPSDRAPRT